MVPVLPFFQNTTILQNLKVFFCVIGGTMNSRVEENRVGRKGFIKIRCSILYDEAIALDTNTKV